MVERLDVIVGTDGTSPVSLSREDLASHVLVSGSTGSGRTNVVLGMALGAMAAGSGCLHVDGKGDGTALSAFLAAAEACGRTDDVSVVDLGTARVGVTDTWNPFATLPAHVLVDLLAPARSAEGATDETSWRAGALVAAALPLLRFLHDRGLMDLDVREVRGHLCLRRVIDLADADKFPEFGAADGGSVRAYLAALPGYQREKGYKQSQTTLDAHGRAEARIASSLDRMAGALANVTGTTASDVDPARAILDGRLVFVGAPASGSSRADAETTARLVLAMIGAVNEAAYSHAVRFPGDDRPFLVTIDDPDGLAPRVPPDLPSRARAARVALAVVTGPLGPSTPAHLSSATATKLLLRHDVVDAATLASVLPAAAAADRDVGEIASRMARIVAQAAMEEAVGPDPRRRAERLAAHVAAAREHDEASARLRALDVGPSLPALAPGEMVVVRKGAATRVTSFDLVGWEPGLRGRRERGVPVRPDAQAEAVAVESALGRLVGTCAAAGEAAGRVEATALTRTAVAALHAVGSEVPR